MPGRHSRYNVYNLYIHILRHLGIISIVLGSHKSSSSQFSLITWRVSPNGTLNLVWCHICCWSTHLSFPNPPVKPDIQMLWTVLWFFPPCFYVWKSWTEAYFSSYWSMEKKRQHLHEGRGIHKINNFRRSRNSEPEWCLREFMLLRNPSREGRGFGQSDLQCKNRVAPTEICIAGPYHGYIQGLIPGLVFESYTQAPL